MFHSQLKIKYPSCPFVVTDTDITMISNGLDFNEDAVTADVLIKEVKRELQLSDVDEQQIDETEEFLRQYTKQSSSVKKVEWNRITQRWDKINSREHLCLNLHLTAYKDRYGPVIDKEFEDVVSWLLVSLNGNNIVTANKTLNYTVNTHISLSQARDLNKIHDSDEITRSMDPITYKGSIDTQYERFEADIRSARTSARRFVYRDNTEIVKKQDSIVDTNNPRNTLPQKTVEPRNGISRLDLTNNTRAGAQAIRERLANPYKAYRFRTNPELYERCKKIDPCINNVGDQIATVKNSNFRTLIKDVDKDELDFTFESVGFKKVNGILRCSPVGTGRINTESRQTPTTFLSVLLCQESVHITLHKLI